MPTDLERFFRPGSASEVIARANRAAGQPRPTPRPRSLPKPKRPKLPPPTTPRPSPIARRVRASGVSPGVSPATRANASRFHAPGAAARRAEAEATRRFRERIARYESIRGTSAARPRSDTDRARTEAARLVAELNRAQYAGGNPIGRFLGNLGGDAVDVITGIPAGVELGMKGTSYPIFKLLGQDEVADPIGSELRTAGRAMADDYRTRWGPLFRGDFREFGRQWYEHPGLMALDTAAAWSGAGAGVRAGARAGAAATGSQRLARLGSRSIVPGSARYRTPRVLEMRAGPNTARSPQGAAVSRIAVERRPYSANPLTRGIQRGAERVGTRLQRAVDVGADANPALRPFTTEARFRRSAAVQARDLRLGFELERQRQVRRITSDYRQSLRDIGRSRSVRELAAGKGPKRQQIEAALYLHTRDLLRAPGKTPKQARDAVVATMREGIARSPQRKNAQSLRTIEAIANVPDELLDLRTAPREFVRAVEEAKKVSRSATGMRIEAGTITPATAREAAQRPAQMVFGDKVYDPKAQRWVGKTNPLLGRGAAYVPDIPVDPLTTSRRGSPAGAFGRLTQDRVRESHGTLFRSGNVNISPGLPVRALERAMVDKLHPRMVRELTDRFAFRRPNGKAVQGKRAVLAMESDPDNVSLVSRKSLEDAMRLSRDLPEGQMPDDPLRAVEVFEGSDGLAQARLLGKGKRSDLVAMPKAAIDALREGWSGTAGPKLKAYDTPLQLWRRGILAFAPRWYVNSLAGNTLQYGLLTGGDVRSIMQARRGGKSRAIAEAVPERVSGSTNVAETRITDPTRAPRTRTMRGFMAASDKGMEFQHKLDGLFRRAAYINRMKHHLRGEGGKFRKLTPDEIAQAIEDAPAAVKNQALRDVELFMGDYVRLRPWERAYLRRVLPFYSWMRVIGKLMLSVPVRHPKRVAITAAVSRAAAEAVNPEDRLQRILANRGRIKAGGFAMRTAGANPFFTHADLIKNMAGRDVSGTVGSLVSNISPIGLQQLASIYSGTTPLGAPISYPPGYGDSFQAYGRSPQRIDPVTGLPDYFQPDIPMAERLFQTVPLAPQIIRGVASGNRRPYDVTTTMDLLNYRFGSGGDEGQLFMPERDRAMQPIPGVGPFLAWAGLNFQRYDPRQEQADFRRMLDDAREAQRQTRRRQRRR